MPYVKQKIIEYAQLAQQCYNKSEDGYQLPRNWEAIFTPENRGTWDTSYVIYANSVENEVVLSIRGTCSLFNILADTSLLAAALSGKPIVAPDTQQVEYVAKSIQHFNLNASIDELHHLGQTIRNFDKTVGSSMNNLVLSLIYIAAISTGLYCTTALANISVITAIIAGGAMASFSTAALMELKDQTYRKLVEKLEDSEHINSIEAFGNALIKFKQQNFPNFTFKIIGHSLGAVIAELCAVKIGVECITFESPGTKETLGQLAQYRNKPCNNIVNFLSAPNIINTLNHHSGTIYRVKLPHTNGSFSLIHGTNCIAQSASRVLTYSSLGMFGIGISMGKDLVIKGATKVGLGAVGTKLTGGAAGLWRDVNWLKKQHSIDKIVNYLQSSNPQLVEMESWPWVYWKGSLLEFARDFVPLQKDKPGIRNLVDEEGMREAQISRIPGYREKNTECLF